MQTLPILFPADLTAATLEPWLAVIAAADRAGWPLVLLGSTDAGDPFDGLSLAAFCASRTQAIRLCATVAPAGFEPFTLARGLGTLDHLSGGRAGWRLAGPADAARTTELADVTGRLLTSWGQNALIEDRDAGLISDTAAVRSTNHEGRFFAVRGPLNLPQSPQGVPPRYVLPGDSAGAGAIAIDPVPMTLAEAQAALA